jgi:hypothetical protein
MLFMSGILLLYTAVMVPVQIFMWEQVDSCSAFPTLFFDIFVDIFFLVTIFQHFILLSVMFELLMYLHDYLVSLSSFIPYDDFTSLFASSSVKVSCCA